MRPNINSVYCSFCGYYPWQFVILFFIVRTNSCICQCLRFMGLYNLACTFSAATSRKITKVHVNLYNKKYIFGVRCKNVLLCPLIALYISISLSTKQEFSLNCHWKRNALGMRCNFQGTNHPTHKFRESDFP